MRARIRYSRSACTRRCAPVTSSPPRDQDHEVVPFSAPWRPEILTAIENSDKFIFVLSPESLDSQPCANELQHAIDVNKQVIPVSAERREGQLVPSSVGDLNWIFFTDDAHFDSAFAQLTDVLSTIWAGLRRALGS